MGLLAIYSQADSQPGTALDFDANVSTAQFLFHSLWGLFDDGTNERNSKSFDLLVSNLRSASRFKFI